MKRRIARALAVAGLATLGVSAPFPASAHNDVCVGTGTTTLDNGLGAVVLSPAKTAKLVVTFSFVSCAAKQSLAATGYVTGNCGLSSGGGTTADGLDFAFTSTGTVLVVTGAVTGVVLAPVDATRANNSCTDQTAKSFLLIGVLVKTHTTSCTTNSATLTTDCNVV